MCSKEKAYYIAKGTKEKDTLKLFYYTNKTGVLVMEASYTDSTLAVKNGHYALYSDDGLGILKKGYYIKDKEEGYWMYWDQGHLTDSILYEDGIDILSISYRYDSNGILNTRELKDSKTKTFEITSFGEEGNITRHTKWINGTGDQVYYYTNGQVQTIEKYKNKKLDAVGHYRPDGTKISEKEFRKEQEKIIADLRKQIEDKTPSFPGGSAGFRSFFEKNFRTPLSFQEAVRNAVPIRISFYLDKDGYAYNIVVEESTDLDLRRAVENVFKNMPAWNMNGFKEFGPIRYNITLSRGY
jgi:antitoxin component YwqK of YwqJK toxin-antitoxin module